MPFILRYTALCILVLVLTPALIVSFWGWLSPPPSPLDSPYEITLFITSTQQVVVLPLEDYVTGVIGAEMPALFEPAALQAQACAARTYAVRRARQFGGGGCSRHALADVCDDPAHCQAYLPLDALQFKWGMVAFNEYYSRIRQAAYNTAGMVITHRGQVIDPIYHSTCGGKTEDAHKVWSNRYLYLQSVACGYCEHSNRLTDTKTFTVNDFVSRLKQHDNAITVSAQGFKGRSLPVSIAKRSESGRVLEVRVGNRTIRGTEFRSIFGLQSTNFTLANSGDGVTVTTIGFGHGVGMCQYGADGMAKAGKDFKEIIAHYYQGAVLTHLTK